MAELSDAPPAIGEEEIERLARVADFAHAAYMREKGASDETILTKALSIGERRAIARAVAEAMPVACAYCTFALPAPAEAAALQQHVLEDCEFHPLRRAERERDEARAALRDLWLVHRDACSECDAAATALAAAEQPRGGEQAK